MENYISVLCMILFVVIMLLEILLLLALVGNKKGIIITSANIDLLNHYGSVINDSDMSPEKFEEMADIAKRFRSMDERIDRKIFQENKLDNHNPESFKYFLIVVRGSVLAALLPYKVLIGDDMLYNALYPYIRHYRFKSIRSIIKNIKPSGSFISKLH